MKLSRRLRRRAAKLPGWARDSAATKAYPSRRPSKIKGTFGPASPVRRIDPADHQD